MISELRAKFDEAKIDALLVTDPTNIFYLSGFKGTNGFVLITKNHQYLITDSRYLEKAERVTSAEWRVADMVGGLTQLICNLALKHKAKSIGVEAYSMKVSLFHNLEQAGCPIKIVPTQYLVEKVRQIKTDAELRALRESQKLNEQVLKLLLKEIKVGGTEAELAWKLRIIAKDIGAQDLSFPPIIAFGAHSSMPHHETSHNKKLRRGDLVLIDMGLIVKNLASDMTRTFFTKTPTKEQREVYEAVLEGQRRAINVVKPKATCDEIDKAARVYICDAGYHKKFGHATGHGIGLDVHEVPAVSKGSKTELVPGMVITIEPGVYLPGRLGVRIEDMVEVTDKGNRNLTGFPKKITEVVLKI